MKRKTVFETLDGKHFATKQDACNHADAIYATQLSRTVAEMVNASDFKAHKLGDWIDTNLKRFAVLATLKADTELENPELEWTEE